MRSLLLLFNKERFSILKSVARSSLLSFSFPNQYIQKDWKRIDFSHITFQDFMIVENAFEFDYEIEVEIDNENQMMRKDEREMEEVEDH